MLEFSQKSRHLISKAVCFISRSCGDVHIPVRFQEVCMRAKTVPSMTVCIEWAMSSALQDRDITEGLASVLIRGCCGISRGPAHSAADTMKRPSALAHGFVQGKMEHHWFAHRFPPSPVYTCFILSIHPSIPWSPVLDAEGSQWRTLHTSTCSSLVLVTALMESCELMCSTLTQTTPLNSN